MKRYNQFKVSRFTPPLILLQIVVSLSCNPGDNVWNTPATAHPSNTTGTFSGHSYYTCGDLISSLVDNLVTTDSDSTYTISLNDAKNQIGLMFPCRCGGCYMNSGSPRTGNIFGAVDGAKVALLTGLSCGSVWNLPAVRETNDEKEGMKEHTCGSRITLLIDKDGRTEYEAKRMVSEEFVTCRACGYDGEGMLYGEMMGRGDVVKCRDGLLRGGLKPQMASVVGPTRMKDATKLMTVDEIILSDMIPPSSSRCIANNVKMPSKVFSSTSRYTPSKQSSWDDMAKPFEGLVFQEELVHNNTANARNLSSLPLSTSSSRSYALRVGQGSNLYSFIASSIGESVPPQDHKDAPWIDEVWQSVSVNSQKNKPQDGQAYFIHQAGTYQNDGNYTRIPFYSPRIASYCPNSASASSSEMSCSFGSWGQQAHVPTTFESNVLYMNRYRDCGEGVLEFTSVIHNDPHSKDELDYLNVPWGGVRASHLMDIMLSSPSGNVTWQFPLAYFGAAGETTPPLSKTGGYTLFVPEIRFPNGTYFLTPTATSAAEFITDGSPRIDMRQICSNEPDRVCFRVSQNNGAVINAYHSKMREPRGEICINVPLMPTVKSGFGTDRSLLFMNTRVNGEITVSSVVQWAWSGSTLVFCVPRSANTTNNKVLAVINNFLRKGDYIDVIPAGGVTLEESMGLALVHGVDKESQNGGWANAPARLRFGGTPYDRDYNVFTINILATVRAGDTYINRQFFVTNQYQGLKDRASQWVKETQQELLSVGDLPSREIALAIAHDKAKSLVSVGAFLKTQLSLCRQRRNSGGVKRDEVVVLCVGTSTPQAKTLTALYFVTCGDLTYVGSNKYHFSSASKNNDGKTILRSYVCDGQPVDVRPTFQLLGFFNEEECDPLINAVYDKNFCDAESFGVVSESL